MKNEYKRGAYAERKLWYRLLREVAAKVRDSGVHTTKPTTYENLIALTQGRIAGDVSNWANLKTEAIAVLAEIANLRRDATGALKLAGDQRRKSIRLAAKRKGGFGRK